MYLHVCIIIKHLHGKLTVVNGIEGLLYFYLQNNEPCIRPMLLPSTTLPNKENYTSISVSST